MTLSDEAIQYVKSNKAVLIEKFCSLSNFSPSSNPFTMFMAGSPGAGKTEFSRAIIPLLQQRDPNCAIVRIDADEIRELIPQFNGHNSHQVQGAASIGVEKLFDYVLDHKQNCILDGTFAHINVAKRNIDRALKRNRKVGIFYLYQDPLIAWDFTKKREQIEKRNIPKEAFIEAFFAARDNVVRIKEEHGSLVELNVIIKNELNTAKELLLNVATIDNDLGSKYTMSSLLKQLED